MSSKLHHWYSIEKAIAAFEGASECEWFCEDQFAVLPKAVICFGVIGQPLGESHVSSPSRFIWRPRRLDYELSDELPWLPTKVREVYDRSRNPTQKIRQHHIFLRTPTDVQFLYAGLAHLGSYGSSPGSDVKQLTADFSLNVRLPRDAWLKFGGYPGWLVELNHNEHHVDVGNTPEFDRLIRMLPNHEFSHLTLTRYEEDSLTIHTNKHRGWLMYLREPGDAGVYTRDTEYHGSADAQEVFRCGCGIELEFGAAQTLPRELAMQATVEFFQTGEL